MVKGVISLFFLDQSIDSWGRPVDFKCYHVVIIVAMLGLGQYKVDRTIS